MTNEEIAELEKALQDIESKGYKRIVESLDVVKRYIEPIVNKQKETNYKRERNLKDSFRFLHTPSAVPRMQTDLKSSVIFMKELEDIVTYCDREIQDLLHFVELVELTDEEMLDAVKKLKEARNERRKAKDNMALLRPLADFYRINKKVLDGLSRVHAEVSNVEKNLKARNYKPRELTALEEAFNKAKANDCNE